MTNNGNGHVADYELLLRAGFPYQRTLGMRRLTWYPTDFAIGDDHRIYSLSRFDGTGSIRAISWDDEDLGAVGPTFTWPGGIVRDADERLYVSDEATHQITVITSEGDEVAKWGEHGSEPGQLNRPSHMAFDAEERLWISDSMNHRVQLFSKDGQYITAFGESGSGDGQFNRPAGITVDHDGDIYVADRANNRVQLFDRDARYVEQFIGDATLSRMGREYILANPRVLRLRDMTTLEKQKRLRVPVAVKIDDEGHLMIGDFGSHRIQVYKKDAQPLSAADVMPHPGAPTLTTV
jgi:sugar lactone lactonase YvrE